jgi:hypothetical protein
MTWKGDCGKCIWHFETNLAGAPPQDRARGHLPTGCHHCLCATSQFTARPKQQRRGAAPGRTTSGRLARGVGGRRPEWCRRGSGRRCARLGEAAGGGPAAVLGTISRSAEGVSIVFHFHSQRLLLYFLQSVSLSLCDVFTALSITYFALFL